MRTETLSYFKDHANHLEIDSPLLITQKGKARFVLQNVEDYEYRQYLIDEHNIVFYQVDEENRRITLLAVMDSRQSIQKLLSEVMLLS